MWSSEAEQIQAIIDFALAEDIGDGDVTSQYTVPADRQYTGEFLVKAHGVIAGLDVTERCFRTVEPAVRFEQLFTDGAVVKPGDIVAKVAGPGQALLSAERTALNFLQRMSGIATATHRYVEAVAGTNAIILDTRKTAPGQRLTDKQAVAWGGGQNHRIGLFDMALIKENHIAAAGGITAAVNGVRVGRRPSERPIEVEVRNFERAGRSAGPQCGPHHARQHDDDPNARRRCAGRGRRAAGGFGRRQSGDRARDRRDGRRLHFSGRADALGGGAGCEFFVGGGGGVDSAVGPGNSSGSPQV